MNNTGLGHFIPLGAKNSGPSGPWTTFGPPQKRPCRGLPKNEKWQWTAWTTWTTQNKGGPKLRVAVLLSGSPKLLILLGKPGESRKTRLEKSRKQRGEGMERRKRGAQGARRFRAPLAKVRAGPPKARKASGSVAARDRASYGPENYRQLAFCSVCLALC